MYVYISIHMYIYIYIYTHVWVYIYIYIYILAISFEWLSDRANPEPQRLCKYYASAAQSRGGEVPLTEILPRRIAGLASNCSTGNCLSHFNKRIKLEQLKLRHLISKSSKLWIWARWGFPTVASPLPIVTPASPKCQTCTMRAKLLDSAKIQTIIQL